MSTKAANDSYDIVIIGGGLVGTSLALALHPLNLRVALLEAATRDNTLPPVTDQRTLALNWGSRQILEGIGAWRQVEPLATPIHRLHVSDAGHSGITRLDRTLIGQSALGYVVPAHSLSAALSAQLKTCGTIDHYTPAICDQVSVIDTQAVVRCSATALSLTARLVVLADGGRSTLRQQFGLNAYEKTYDQMVLVTTVLTSKVHGQRAFERFTVDGPLALLPLVGPRFALAWTLPSDQAPVLASLPESIFLAKLQHCFGDRAGTFLSATARHVFPLHLTDVPNAATERAVAIGNAAHVMHPVAGQGLNLGLRDVAELAERLQAAHHEAHDIGSTAFLAAYVATRRGQTRRVLSFTDGLVRLFSNNIPGVGVMRNIGLNLLDIAPPIKRTLLRRTTGLAGRLPRLARGLPLQTHAKAPETSHG